MTSKSFAQGDVVAIDFPFSSGKDGKNRPALVLAGPSEHGDYTVAMISSAKQNDGISIASSDFASGALKQDSFVRATHLFTCEAASFVLKRGTLNPKSMKRVLEGICPVLGCKS